MICAYTGGEPDWNTFAERRVGFRTYKFVIASAWVWTDDSEFASADFFGIVFVDKIDPYDREAPVERWRCEPFVYETGDWPKLLAAIDAGFQWLYDHEPLTDEVRAELLRTQREDINRNP